MKTFNLSLLFLSLSLYTFSQGTVTSVKNKDGKEMLPQAKDWAIQYDIAPVFSFVGDAFSNNSNTTNVSSPFSQGMFVAKYFTDANSAYRFKFGFNISRVTNDTFIPYGSNQEYIESRITSINNITLGFGKEWRRGHGRVQGVFGFEGLIQLGSSTPFESKSYNLTIKEAVDTTVQPSGVERSLGVTRSRGLGFAARSFAGVEYFIAPKVSLGAEFGWGIGYRFQQNETTTESYQTTEQTTVSSGNRISEFVISNGDGSSIFGGNATLNLTFHF